MRKVQQKSSLKDGIISERTKGPRIHKEHGEEVQQFSPLSLACHLHFELPASSHGLHLPRFNQPKCGIICREYLMSYFKRAVFLTSYLVNNSSRSAQRGPSVRTVANSTERETMSVIKAGGRVWNQFAHLWPPSPEGYCHSWGKREWLRCRVKPFYGTK